MQVGPQTHRWHQSRDSGAARKPCCQGSAWGALPGWGDTPRHLWGSGNECLGHPAEVVESGPTEMSERHRSTCLGQDEHQKGTRDLRAAAAAPLHVGRGEADASHASFRPRDLVVRGVDVCDRHERATRVFTRSTKCSEDVFAVDDRLTEKGDDGRGWVRLRVDPPKGAVVDRRAGVTYRVVGMSLLPFASSVLGVVPTVPIESAPSAGSEGRLRTISPVEDAVPSPPVPHPEPTGSVPAQRPDKYQAAGSGHHRIQYPCGWVSASRTGAAPPGPMWTSVVARSGPSRRTGEGGVGKPGVSKGDSQ